MRWLQKVTVAVVVVVVSVEVPDMSHLGARVMACMLSSPTLFMTLQNWLQQPAFMTNMRQWVRACTMARMVKLTTFPMALIALIYLARQCLILWQFAIGVTSLTTKSVVPTVLVALQHRLQLFAILLKGLPRPGACFVTGSLVIGSSFSIVAILVANFDTCHEIAHDHVEVAAVIIGVLVVSVAPPLPVLNLINISCGVVEVPKPPHFRASVMTYMAPWLALLMACCHLLQRFAFWPNESQRTRAFAVTEVVALSAPLVAHQEFSDPAGQLWACWQWALGVASVPAMALPALVVTRPDGLELFTFLLEFLPWLRAGFVASTVVTPLVADLHVLHFLLHFEMEDCVLVTRMLIIMQPPTLMESPIFFGRGIRVSTCMPNAPHLRARVVARPITCPTLVMTMRRLEQGVTFASDVVHWTWTRMMAQVFVTLATPLVARFSLLHFTCQFRAFWQRALGVARVAGMAVPTFLVA